MIFLILKNVELKLALSFSVAAGIFVCSFLFVSTKSFFNFHCHGQRRANFDCLEQKNDKMIL